MRKLLEKIVDVRPGELLPAVIAGCAFFCLLFGYFMMRPLRDAMGLEGGVDSLRVLFLVTLGVMLLVNIAWVAAVAARLPRRFFVPLLYHVAIACLLVFLLVYLVRGDSLRTGQVFYVFLSTFNVLAVSVFWQLMVDVFSLEQAKRLFGFIGVGGTTGAIAGSAYAWQLSEKIGPVGLWISAIVLIECASLLCILFGRRVAKTVSDRAATDAKREVGGTAWSGIVRIVRSPYLLGIASYVMIFTILSTLLYFEKARIVEATTVGRDERASLFALIELIAQTATVVIQLFLTGRLMKWIGVGAMLAVLPAAFFAGFAALLAYPTILAVGLLDGVRRAGNHGCAKPARETLFTVIDRDDKFKAKSIIDTVFYRGGDVVGTAADKGLAAAGAAAGALALPLSAVGIAVALWLGRRERTLRDAHYAHAAPNSEESPP